MTGMLTLDPLKAVPPPGAGLVVPNQYSPPATPLARPLTKGSVAPFRERVIETVPTGTAFGVRVIPVKVGAVRSIRRVVLIAVLQFPAASFARTYTVWLPAVRAEIVAAGIVALMVAFGETEPGVIAAPVPAVPSVSMKYSPPAILLLPVAASSPVALTVTAVLLEAGGVNVNPLIVGAALSMIKVAVVKGPQFPTASLAWILMMWFPFERAFTVSNGI